MSEIWWTLWNIATRIICSSNHTARDGKKAKPCGVEKAGVV